MFDFNKPNIEITDVSDDKKYGRFVVEPLERGYGTTLGNSLRRIMLSSLPGAAISSVKIDGVLHEFSSIPGVKEDVTEIIMNLKSLAIKNTSESDEVKTAYIEYEGEGVVTGADIQADSDIEIVNPEQVIATLSGGKDSKLYMELTITKGRGYVSSDKNKTEDMPIGVLPIDSIYTPIDRVNLTVQNTRVGQITDYDKLTLDVWTKGTMAPDEAVSLAAKVLSEHLKLFIDLSEVAQQAEVMIEKEDDEKETKTIYAVNKIACENLLYAYRQNFDIPYTIFRICVPFGNMFSDDYSFGTIGFFIRQASNDRRITLYGDGSIKRTFTSMHDLCKQIVEVGMERVSDGEIYNIGGHTYSLRNAAEIIASYYKAEISFISWPERDLKMESGSTYFDSSKIERVMGKIVFESLEELLKQ